MRHYFVLLLSTATLWAASNTKARSEEIVYVSETEIAAKKWSIDRQNDEAKRSTQLMVGIENAQYLSDTRTGFLKSKWRGYFSEGDHDEEYVLAHIGLISESGLALTSKEKEAIGLELDVNYSTKYWNEVGGISHKDLANLYVQKIGYIYGKNLSIDREEDVKFALSALIADEPSQVSFKEYPSSVWDDYYSSRLVLTSGQVEPFDPRTLKDDRPKRPRLMLLNGEPYSDMYCGNIPIPKKEEEEPRYEEETQEQVRFTKHRTSDGGININIRNDNSSSNKFAGLPSDGSGRIDVDGRLLEEEERKPRKENAFWKGLGAGVGAGIGFAGTNFLLDRVFGGRNFNTYRDDFSYRSGRQSFSRRDNYSYRETRQRVYMPRDRDRRYNTSSLNSTIERNFGGSVGGRFSSRNSDGMRYNRQAIRGGLGLNHDELTR